MSEGTLRAVGGERINMKKLFNRTKMPKQEWNEYNEDEYNWDSAEEIPDDDAYYEEENDEAYYTDGDDFAEDDEAYYADEDGLSEDDEAYYAEEDDLNEGDGAYYIEEDAPGEDDETFYADEDDIGEEDEAFFAEDDGTYYADSDAMIEKGAKRDYAADDYIEKETVPVDRIGGRKSSRPAERKKGFWVKFLNIFSSMSVLDRMIVGTGAAVLIMVLITAGVYISGRVSDGHISELAGIGAQLDGIDIIGGTGLLAVEDAQIAKMTAASIVADELEGEDKEDEEDKEYNEQDYQNEVQVVMEFTSIQRDLKIKFINKKTKKLIANVPFALNVTDPDGKSFIWSDDDMDGIIYKKDITPGSYKIALEALSDEKYSKYAVSTKAETVTVKKNIEYKQVDVDNEVKSEDEVDVSKEDTTVNETVVESTLQDTVAWVESTVTSGSYIEVPKSSVPDPKTLVARILDKTFLRATESVSGGDEKDDERQLTVIPLQPVSVAVGQTLSPILQVEVKLGEEVVTGAAFKVIPPSDGGCATVIVDNSGLVSVTGVKEGTAPYTIEVTYENQTAKADLNVTVTAAREITLDKTELTVFVEDDPVKITAGVSNAGPNVPVVTAESSHPDVLQVKCEKNVVTVQGVKASDQTVTVTVTYSEGSYSTSATCLVKVRANPEKDKETKLKDSNGTQLYVKVDEKTYREAVHADYYNKDIKFYIMGDVKYTGWQTIDNKVYFFTASGDKVTGEQIIQGAKYNFASDGSLVTGSGALGIDVSKWNGNIDWVAVKNSGINYVIIRCGYRGYTTGSLIEDPKFTANIKGATAAGLKVGIYFFTQAIDEREAVEEASMVISQIKNYKISYPVFLDVESSGAPGGSGRADSIDKATRTAVCKAFCETIKNAGYNAGIYANKNWLETKINASELSAYKIWLAQYASAPTYTGRYDLWQYRSTGRVSGISTDVDMNLSYLGY